MGTKEVQDHPGHAEAASQLQDRRCCLRCCRSVVIIIVTAHSGLLVQCCGLSNIWYSLSIDTCVNIPQMCKNLNMQESVKKENQHKNLLEIPDSVRYFVLKKLCQKSVEKLPFFPMWQNDQLSHNLMLHTFLIKGTSASILLINFSDGSVRNRTSTQSLNFDAF